MSSEFDECFYVFAPMFDLFFLPNLRIKRQRTLFCVCSLLLPVVHFRLFRLMVVRNGTGRAMAASQSQSQVNASQTPYKGETAIEITRAVSSVLLDCPSGGGLPVVELLSIIGQYAAYTGTGLSLSLASFLFSFLQPKPYLVLACVVCSVLTARPHLCVVLCCVVLCCGVDSQMDV